MGVILVFTLTSYIILNCSMAKIKVLDASGPLGFPKLLSGSYGATTTISAVSFSPDGEVIHNFSCILEILLWYIYFEDSEFLD